MVRAGVSAVVAGVILATLNACGQSTAADQNRRPQTRVIVHDGNWSTLEDTTLSKCRQKNHLRDNILCSAHPRGAATTGHRAEGHGVLKYWTRQRMQSATPN